MGNVAGRRLCSEGWTGARSAIASGFRHSEGASKSMGSTGAGDGEGERCAIVKDMRMCIRCVCKEKVK